MDEQQEKVEVEKIRKTRAHVDGARAHELKAQGGKTNAEIAAILGCSVASLYRHLAKAKPKSGPPAAGKPAATDPLATVHLSSKALDSIWNTLTLPVKAKLIETLCNTLYT